MPSRKERIERKRRKMNNSNSNDTWEKVATCEFGSCCLCCYSAAGVRQAEAVAISEFIFIRSDAAEILSVLWLPLLQIQLQFLPPRRCWRILRVSCCVPAPSSCLPGNCGSICTSVWITNAAGLISQSTVQSCHNSLFLSLSLSLPRWQCKTITQCLT